MGIVIDLIGKRFGRLVVLRRDGSIHGNRKAWLCACDCGGTAVSSTTKLQLGEKLSCGCLERENNDSLRKHGHYGTRTYRIWSNMKSRCLNQKTKFYPQYGGRGIKVHEKWMTFDGFFADMGECPDGMTIERMDNDLGYNKENCRWATKKDQANNRSSNIVVVHNGVEMTLKQLAEAVGVKYTTLYARHKRGLPLEQIIGNPGNRTVTTSGYA